MVGHIHRVFNGITLVNHNTLVNSGAQHIQITGETMLEALETMDSVIATSVDVTILNPSMALVIALVAYTTVLMVQNMVAPNPILSLQALPQTLLQTTQLPLIRR
eukprot:TRINITY_DN1065_c0_g1_i4.p2 TRINITY_DN1065_c0_g1~~TRINITY_DN1065_c0_g1_i4.p2  ORF type:complete len:105 (+),score=8.63 TRINITY_DN1065_c0_g1_i4:193-507(+)